MLKTYQNTDVNTYTVPYYTIIFIIIYAFSCKLLIIGGGSGGCTIAAKCSHDSHFKKGDVVVVEPSDRHYYQPMFTLIGGGIKKLEDSYRSMKSVLPKSATWLQTSVAEFFPKNNFVITENGQKISYDYLLVAMGLQLNYHEVIPTNKFF